MKRIAVLGRGLSLALAVALLSGCLGPPRQAVRQPTSVELEAEWARTREAARRAKVERERVQAQVRAALSWRDEAQAWGSANLAAADAERARLQGLSEIVWESTALSPEAGVVHTFRGSAEGPSTPFAPNGTLLTTVSRQTVRLFDAATGRELRALEHPARVRGLAFSPDGRAILTAAADGTARLWDTAAGSLLHTLAHGSSLKVVAFSPDASTLLTGGADGSVRLWSARDGQAGQRFQHDGGVCAAAFSADGSKLIIGDGNGTARLWDVNSGASLKSLRHAPAVTAVALSGTGEHLLTGSADGSVVLWQVASGEAVERFEIDGSVRSVAFSPDGRLLAAKSDTGQAVVRRPRDADLEELAEGGERTSFALVGALVEQRTRRELDRRQALPDELTDQLATLKARRFDPPRLVKGEFEKTSAFEARVAKARAGYAAEIAAHNRTVAGLEAEIAAHLEARSRLPRSQVNQIVERSFLQVFGAPVLGNVRYDADSEAFFADLTSSSPHARDFRRTVALAERVPPARARELKPQLARAKARIRFRLDQGTLTWAGCDLLSGGQAYAAVPADQDYRPVAVAARIDPVQEAHRVDLADLRARGSGQAVSVDFSESAEVAALRKQLAARRDRAARSEAEKAEVEKLKAQLAALAERDDWGPTPAYRELLAALPKAPGRRRGLAVVIGNRSYRNRHPDLPDVKYARNDARAVKAYAEQSLGYREVIYLEDATKAALESHFGTARYRRGIVADALGGDGSREVFVYYSGHGVPGLSDGKGYLLPVDADPKRVELTGYPLEVLYQNLAALGAKRVTVVVDACFSGGSGAGTVVQSASPGLLRVVDPRLQVPGAVVVTASQSDEVASWDDEVHMGLLTRSFLEGVTGAADGFGGAGKRDGTVTAGELKAYLEASVPRTARRLHGRDQHPQVVGPAERVLAVLR